MSDKVENYELMFAVYGTEEGAGAAADALRAMDKSNVVHVIDAATLVKDSEGNTTVKQESLPTVKKGLGVGALIGGAVGLLFPPSIIAAAALGAGVGAGSAKLAQMALENPELQEAANNLEPGSSAFIAIVDNTWVSQMAEVIKGYDNLAEATLGADAAGVIGTLETEDGAAVYGSASTDDAAMDFVAATDGDVVAGRATATAIGEDGTVVAREVAGVAATDEDGNVAAITSDTIAAVDADGNAVVAQAVDGGVVPAEALEAGDDSANDGSSDGTDDSDAS
ncbi:MAG: DUF1269 domain-containing protein [Acidimicrobiia bacterium]